MSDFFRPTRTSAIKCNTVEKISAIRLYPVYGGHSLQVRATLRLANGKEGKDFIIASADLNSVALGELAAAIEEARRAK